MGKVYEALQHVYAKGDLVAQVREDPSKEKRTSNRIVTQDVPFRRMGKEMARLHQGISTLLPQCPKPIIQFIGARQGEGTSTIVWEFGCLIAEKMNNSVLIVDGDRKTMKHHQSLGVHVAISLHEVLEEEQLLNGSIPKAKDLRLYLCGLTSKDQVKFQAAYLGKNKEKWTKLRSLFDYVLIDSPPVSLSDDALAFCSMVDGVVLVLEAESTRFQVVSHLKERIIQNGGNILGLVFNKQRYHIPQWIYKHF